MLCKYIYILVKHIYDLVMTRPVLLSWIGKHDLKAPTAPDPVRASSIVTALKARPFSHVVLFDNQDSQAFISWLRSSVVKPPQTLEVIPSLNEDDSDLGVIYGLVTRKIQELLAAKPRPTLFFHLSPGSSIMTAAWTLAAGVYDANLLRSTEQDGLLDVSLPREVSVTIDQAKRSDLNLARYTADLPEDLSTFSEIIHTSPKMQAAVTMAARAAKFEDVPVLLLGEPGTGKDLFARAIHDHSKRRGKFQALNCGGYPSGLLASELFGAKEGAFTGAVARQGAIRAARNGTLFLDEIADLPLEVQPTLLRFLQRGEVPQLGSEQVEVIPTRVIAATNRDLFEMCRAGTFREDLLFRLDIIRVNIPPLREYSEDIGIIADHLMGRMIRKHGKKMKLAPDAYETLRQYDWPGNVRELNAVLMRCYVLERGGTITAAAVRQAILPFGKMSVVQEPIQNLDDAIARLGKGMIDQALASTGGKKAAAARVLGLNSPQTMNNRYGMYQQRLGRGVVLGGPSS